MQGLNLFSFHSDDLSLFRNNPEIDTALTEVEDTDSLSDEEWADFKDEISSSTPLKDSSQSIEIELPGNLSSKFIKILNETKSDFFDVLENGSKKVNTSILGRGELKLGNDVIPENAKRIKNCITSALEENKLVIAVLSAQSLNDQECHLEQVFFKTLELLSMSTLIFI